LTNEFLGSWSRPIYNLDSNFKQLTREERLERDMEHIKSLNRRNSNENSHAQSVDDMMGAADKYKTKKKKNDDGSEESSKKYVLGFC
jgi:hypothetical protein